MRLKIPAVLQLHTRSHLLKKCRSVELTKKLPDLSSII